MRGIAPLGMVVGHYQPLADDGPLLAPSDQTCLLQSVQKTKISKPICGRLEGFQEAPWDSLVFGIWERFCAPAAKAMDPDISEPIAPACIMFQSAPGFATSQQ
jgi:hypothetical protein